MLLRLQGSVFERLTNYYLSRISSHFEWSVLYFTKNSDNNNPFLVSPFCDSKLIKHLISQTIVSDMSFNGRVLCYTNLRVDNSKCIMSSMLSKATSCRSIIVIRCHKWRSWTNISSSLLHRCIVIFFLSWILTQQFLWYFSVVSKMKDAWIYTKTIFFVNGSF